ncbi:MAG TPA: BBP7 family outer membrane beta-barrel protein, partial [Gemmataceae bacterium]|nr:BBP7 family outer membrane beta-barrel protein [Gemmataceae bacterium]
MRRILLGGLGLALGATVSPAVAQDVPARRVTLGRPIPLSETQPPPPSGVTPVGLIAPPGHGVPVVVTNPGAVPVGAFPVPMGVQPKAGGVPSVTEVRGIPSGPDISIGPPTTYGAPGTVFTGPVTMPPGGVIVPSVGPDACPPGLEAPMFGAPVPGEVCGPEGPGFRALSRLGVGQGSWWTSAEYLMWWTRSTHLPPLITTSSPQFNGFLGVGDTRTVLGGSFGDTFHGGARFGLGHWFDCEQSRGIEGRFFFLGRNGNEFGATTNNFPVLARPFFNVNQPVGSFAEVVAAPGLATGGVLVNLQNSMWGADVNFRRNLGGSDCARLDALV